VLRVNGPFAGYEALNPPPVGFRWIYRTSIPFNCFDLQGGGRVALPSLYLQALPQIKVNTYWEEQRRRDTMIEEMSNNQKPDKWQPGAEPFLKDYPTIYQYCTDCWSKTPKGVVPRTPCTLSFTFFEASVMLSMNDKDKGRSTNTNAETVVAALGLLEEHLQAGNVPWRYWKR